jgi:hypothetical protein
MDLILILGWLLLGFIGCHIIWLGEKTQDDSFWCPSPRRIVMTILGTLTGPYIFVISLFCLLIIFCIENSNSEKFKWFITPICKGK